jgi:hypothetical protein
MRKCAFALNVFLLAASTVAQQAAVKDRVVIAVLELSGTTHVSAADLDDIVAEVKGQPHRESHQSEIGERILWGFQERGYYKAVVSDPNINYMGKVGGEKAVAVTAGVEDGEQYRLATISFASDGGTEFNAQQLRGVFAIGDGDIFNAEKIRRGLDDLRRLYASHGYINFTPVPNTEADDEAATVALKIDMDEGKQFHLGGLVLDGEEPHAGDGAKLLAAWKPMEGGVYDGTKIEQWWQLAVAMLPAGSRMEQMLGLKQDAASATVTGYLQFPESK